jgi:hypothetical protein
MYKNNPRIDDQHPKYKLVDNLPREYRAILCLRKKHIDGEVVNRNQWLGHIDPC